MLERFGLGSALIAKIMVLYEEIESVLKRNGRLCKPFKVTRGIRLGCPLSGMLYALSIKPVLHDVRSSITGLVLSDVNMSFSLSAYADDIIVFVRSKQDVNKLGIIVGNFCRFLAAQVNWAKSEALAVGDWLTGLPRLQGGLKW